MSAPQQTATPAEIVEKLLQIATDAGFDNPIETTYQNLVRGMRQAEADGDQAGWDQMALLHDELRERALREGREIP